MVYETLAIFAGAIGGSVLEPYITRIRRANRVSRYSGVSILKLDTKKAASIDAVLSGWSGLFSTPDQLWKVDEYAKTLPEKVQEAWRKHINLNGLKTGSDEYVNDKYTMKDKVREFYKEPVVQEYLKRAA